MTPGSLRAHYQPTWLRKQESHLRSPGYEPGGFLLSHSAVNYYENGLTTQSDPRAGQSAVDIEF